MPTALPSPRLFPPFVAQHCVQFDEAGAALDQFPGVVLAPSLEGAVQKRKNEFLAGRWCAREALRRCAPALVDAPVHIGAKREPVWPNGIVGAITHTHGFASVAVARSVEARGLGLDAEMLISQDVATRIASQIASEDELSSVMASAGIDLALALTIVFSVKETLFKALYPHVGRYFDFSDARVQRVEPGGGRFEVQLVSDLTSEWTRGASFEGMYEVNACGIQDLVCSALTLG